MRAFWAMRICTEITTKINVDLSRKHLLKACVKHFLESLQGVQRCVDFSVYVCVIRRQNKP